MSQAVLSDGMTYRTNPTTGDKVSLLGYGCMRWPSVGGRSAREGNEEIDQEMVNRLVDFAIEHGVNYFDTSPAYCRGTSERATGIALSRHPREKYLIATKLSNFAPSTWTREGAIAMYHNSMKELQVDYLDYYLLHGIGMGSGMEEMMARYFDNGIIDFLMEERKAGRIRNLGFSYHGDVKCFDWLLERHDVYKWDFVQIQLNYLDWKYAKQINPRNTDAEYLYNALAERGIPDHGAAFGRPPLQRAGQHRGPAQGARPAEQCGLMGIPLRRQLPRSADRPERHDPDGAPAGQPPDLLSHQSPD